MERLAAYVTLSSGWKRFLISVAAGAFAALMLPPFGIFIVGFVSFSILVWLIDGASGDADRGVAARLWPAFLTGWAFGLGYFVAGLWWAGSALLVEADEFAWALPLAVLGLPAYLALYYGLAAAVARLFWTDGFVRILALAGASPPCSYSRRRRCWRQDAEPASELALLRCYSPAISDTAPIDWTTCRNRRLRRTSVSCVSCSR